MRSWTGESSDPTALHFPYLIPPYWALCADQIHFHCFPYRARERLFGGFLEAGERAIQGRTQSVTPDEKLGEGMIGRYAYIDRFGPLVVFPFYILLPNKHWKSC